MWLYTHIAIDSILTVCILTLTYGQDTEVQGVR